MATTATKAEAACLQNTQKKSTLKITDVLYQIEPMMEHNFFKSKFVCMPNKQRHFCSSTQLPQIMWIIIRGLFT